jgi:hypothetical protein
MKRYFAEYEQWMLRRPEGGTSFRECVRNEVETFCGALRAGAAFEPWRFRDDGKADAGKADDAKPVDGGPGDGKTMESPEAAAAGASDETAEGRPPEEGS